MKKKKYEIARYAIMCVNGIFMGYLGHHWYSWETWVSISLLFAVWSLTEKIDELDYK